TEHDEMFVQRHLYRQEVTECSQPIELVLVLERSKALAVRHVEVDDSHVIYGRYQHAALRVIEARDVGYRVGGYLAAQGGDAVIGLLAARDRVISNLREGLERKHLGQELDLLQRKNVGLCGSHPVEHMRQADGQ